MIKGRAMIDGKPVLLLGLSRANCERLLQDQPIRITRDQLVVMGLPAIDVLLIAGETEASISQQLGGLPLQPEVEGQTFRQVRIFGSMREGPND